MIDKLDYRISSYSFRGNYSFLNLTLCTVIFVHSTYRCGNYSREETIQGRKLFAEIGILVKSNKEKKRSLFSMDYRISSYSFRP